MSGLVQQWANDSTYASDLSKGLDIVKSLDIPADPAAFADAAQKFTGPFLQMKDLSAIVTSLGKASPEFLKREATSWAIIQDAAKEVFSKLHGVFLQYLVSMHAYDIDRITKSVLAVLGGDEGAHDDMHKVFANITGLPPSAVGKPFAAAWAKVVAKEDAKTLRALPDTVFAGVKTVQQLSTFLSTLLWSRATPHEAASQNLMALMRPAFLEGLESMSDPEFVCFKVRGFMHLRDALFGHLRLFLAHATLDINKTFGPVAKLAVVEARSLVCLLSVFRVQIAE
jgi:hypothetical protein